MIKFAAGFAFGVIVCTVGFSNLTKIADNTLQKSQTIIKESAK